MIRPGILAVTNTLGKQVGVPATTEANANSAYVFSTGDTTFGGVAVVKKTTGGENAWQDPSYDNTTGIMTFSGAESMAYLDTDELHTATPYSVQVDFNTTTTTQALQYIINNGQGSGIGWEEFTVTVGYNNLRIHTCANAAGGTTYEAVYDVSVIEPNTWYRFGLMFYNSGGMNYLRTYLNGIVKNQVTLDGKSNSSGYLNVTNKGTAVAMPYNSSNGIAIGNDNVNFTGSFFNGQIKDLFIGKTLFWPI